MNEEKLDFAKRFDDFIDQTPDYVRDIAQQFYEWGMEDAKSRQAVIFIPYPVESKKYRQKFLKNGSSDT